MILFLDTADVLGITVIFADELKSSSPSTIPPLRLATNTLLILALEAVIAKKVVYPTLFNVVKSAG